MLLVSAALLETILSISPIPSSTLLSLYLLHFPRQQGCGFVLLIVQPEGINVLRN